MLCAMLCVATLAVTPASSPVASSPVAEQSSGMMPNSLRVAQSAPALMPSPAMPSPVMPSPVMPSPVMPSEADSLSLKPLPTPIIPPVPTLTPSPTPVFTSVTPPNPTSLSSLVAKSAGRSAALTAFYAARGWQPLWVNVDGITTPAGQALEMALTTTAFDNDLDPRDYVLPSKGIPMAREVAYDQALLRLARALRQGAKPAPDGLAVLMTVAEAADVRAAVAMLAPQNPYYQRLRVAIAQYRTLAENGRWPKIVLPGRVRPGERSAGLAEVRQRLRLTGELTQEPLPKAEVNFYDNDLKAAVIRFQENHGLAADGVIGPPTAVALAQPPAALIKGLVLNLNRARVLPDGLEATDVLVNIPGFEVLLFEMGHVALRSRIIVGANQTATPDFSATIQDVIVNPSWNVPDSIAGSEILPKLASNRGYLDSQNMIASLDGVLVNPHKVDWQKVLATGSPRYHFRQKPGEGNSLGHIKIQFPNDYDVYLHDTPKRNLFNRRVRAFSHGCMRVEKVVDLASALLGGGEWSPSRLNDMIAKGETKVAKVAIPRRVNVIYLTAWVDPETGVVQFRDDIYKHDVPKDLEQAAAVKPSPPP